MFSYSVVKNEKYSVGLYAINLLNGNNEDYSLLCNTIFDISFMLGVCLESEKKSIQKLSFSKDVGGIFEICGVGCDVSLFDESFYGRLYLIENHIDLVKVKKLFFSDTIHWLIVIDKNWPEDHLSYILSGINSRNMPKD